MDRRHGAAITTRGSFLGLRVDSEESAALAARVGATNLHGGEWACDGRGRRTGGRHLQARTNALTAGIPGPRVVNSLAPRSPDSVSILVDQARERVRRARSMCDADRSY